MNLTEVKNDDLSEIGKLQPEGWPDIIPDFKFYVGSAYCQPVKTVLGDQDKTGTGPGNPFPSIFLIAGQ